MKMKHRQKWIEVLGNSLSSNAKTYITLAGFLILGIAGGSLFAIFKNASDTDLLLTYIEQFISGYQLTGASKIQIFSLSFVNNLKTGILILSVSLFYILLPLLFINFFAKGFRIGFTVAFIVKCYGLGGSLFALVSLLPQNIIYLSATVIYSVFAFIQAFEIRRLRKEGILYKYKSKIILNTLTAFLLFLLLTTVGSLLESFILPTFIKQLCVLLG